MQEKYDTIGIDYNHTRKADPYIFDKLLSLLDPNLNGKYLDIGCGTGNYTIEFSKKGYQFIGIDPSEKMLDKAKNQNQHVKWKVSKAEDLKLPTASVDGIIASLTIHHWKDLNQSFTELNRVLKPEGVFVLFTSTSVQMKGYWLNHYFPKMLSDSIHQMPSYHIIEESAKNNNFNIITTEKYNIKSDLQDLFLYCGKNNPKMYLNPKIRNGISSFSSLSNAEEVSKGLHFLEKDITSGKVNDVITRYNNTDGDYLFIVFKKTSN
ncbi:class I SAM-dependent methyltransferase [Aquimarina algicola]|uniref:Class I SAM-dependent methyltransferase n=1 Tax=Aquimarina algicola TaxID=2589995 RepID=A0A504JLA3_9FLAO|nr:class I SAM-dependent methyltransferase [Aquimarina algicola]TPN87351.1 class I SAM-dependent methyltransferase [Aquimarina algicola]